jgi:hypothetical protein
MKLSDLITQIAMDLSDPRSVTWPQKQIRFWLDEAIRLVVKYRPDLFLKEYTLTLESGPDYHKVCPCMSLTPDGVLGQSTAEGIIFQPLRARLDTGSMRWFPAFNCQDKWQKPFRLNEFAISSDGTGIRVFPEIPPDETVYVKVRCAVVPDLQDDESEIDDEAVVILVQWVLYRAKNMDTENNPLIYQAAYDNKQNFFALLGIPLTAKRSSTSNKGTTNGSTSQ